jgi:hypothetical protein
VTSNKPLSFNPFLVPNNLLPTLSITRDIARTKKRMKAARIPLKGMKSKANHRAMTNGFVAL